MKRLSIYLILAVTLFLTSCSTMNGARGKNGEPQSELEITAENYRDINEIEASNSTYRQLIAANPNSFQSVLYQHEIMLNSVALGDPKHLVNEIKQTIELFASACNEHYEGATSEAIQNEYDALEDFISHQGKIFHHRYQKTKNKLYADTSKRIYELYLNELYKSFPVNYRQEDYCLILYYYSDITYFTKDDVVTKDDGTHDFYFYEVAANGFTSYLNECKPETLSNDYDLGDDSWTHIYVDVAHGAVLAYDKLTHDEAQCPPIPETPEEAYDKGTFQQYPIDDCRMNFIHASQRYFEAVQTYDKDGQHEFAHNAIYTSGRIYFEHNQFEQAISIFQTVIQIAPKEEAAVFSASYILDSYVRTKQYQALEPTILEFKNNSEFMANPSPYMKEFIVYMDAFEKALNIYEERRKSC